MSSEITFSSLSDLKKHVVNSGFFCQKNIIFDDNFIINVLERIKTAESSKDFFDLACELTKHIHGLDKKDIEKKFRSTNFHIRILTAVLFNKKFKKEIIRLSIEEEFVFEKDLNIDNFESKVFLNTGISLAFLGLALIIETLNENTVSFLRKHITSILKNYIKESGHLIDFAGICFKIESLISSGKYHYTQQEQAEFPFLVDGPELFNYLKIAKSIAGSAFLSKTINIVLSKQFKSAADKAEQQIFKIGDLIKIYGAIHRIEKGIDFYLRYLGERDSKAVRKFFDAYIKNNEINVLFFVKLMCSDLQFKSGIEFREKIIKKIEKASQLKDELNEFSRRRLKVFYGNIEEGDVDWSNKLYITTIKSLSLLAELNPACDQEWKISAALFELKEWTLAMHCIFNKYLVEDEWHKINSFLKKEGVDIEWKSSFYTPLESIPTNKEETIKISKLLFSKIIKTILGMLNTNGGVIVIGLVEKPEAVVRDDLANKLIIKNGRTFFNISSELSDRKTNLDNVRLSIYEELRKETDNTAEKFNDLIFLEEIFLSDQENRIAIVKIVIKKSDRLFFTIKKEGPKIWASLTKRADGQNIDVDLRDYVGLQT
jgi:hypothetical protein